MSDAVVVALIGAVPTTIGAIAALLEALALYRTPRQVVPAGIPGGGGPPGALPPPSRRPTATSKLSRLVGWLLPDHPSVRRLKAIVLASLLAAIVVVLIAIVVIGDTTKIDVSGTRPWTNTYIDVESGDVLEITAGGEVVHSTLSGDKTGPDGFGDVPFQSDVIPGRHGGLIARIGEGPPFFVGSDHRSTVTGSGRLYLGVNDTDTENNSGAFSAKVSVRKRS